MIVKGLINLIPFMPFEITKKLKNIIGNILVEVEKSVLLLCLLKPDEIEYKLFM